MRPSNEILGPHLDPLGEEARAPKQAELSEAVANGAIKQGAVPDDALHRRLEPWGRGKRRQFCGSGAGVFAPPLDTPTSAGRNTRSPIM
jgi:hypothetical protein